MTQPTIRERTSAPKSEERSSRPIIVLEAGEARTIVNEIEAVLLASGLPLYKRGGFIVSPGVDQLPTWNKGKVVAQIIARRQASSLVETAESVAQFMRRNDRGDLTPCGLPQRYALTLMAREHHLRFPVLVTIANTPSISIDGELLDLPGFDPATGVLYDPLDVVFPRVPDLPTESEIKAALSRILLTLHTLDGDFVAPEDKGVALSLLMTSIVRRAIDFAPIHGMDAPVAGSGKSMVIEIASILATGHGAAVMSQGETREEMEKKLGAVLMQGEPLVAIDNCDFPLEGQTLNQTLTQPLVKVRILGKSEMVLIQTSALITATGNNLTAKGDLVRRTLIGRLDPKCARPELRQYNFDPIAYTMENRAQLVADILTLLKAYHNKGRPNLPPEFQGFRRWSNTVRGCICWLAEVFPEERLADPVKTMERVRSTDPILAALKAVLVAWSDEFRDRPVTITEVAKVAGEVTSKPVPGSFSLSHVTPANPELHDALVSVAGRGGRVDVRALSQWVGRNADRVDEVENGRFITLTKAGLLHGTQRWKTVEKKNEGKSADDLSCDF